MTALAARIPLRASFGLVYLLLITAALAGGFAVGALRGSVTFTRTVHTHDTVDATLARTYGKPTNQVDGAQVNQQLAGLTCNVYVKGQALTALVCR